MNNSTNKCTICSIYGESYNDKILRKFYPEFEISLTQEEHDHLMGVLRPLFKRPLDKVGYIRADVTFYDLIKSSKYGDLIMLDMTIQQAKDLITQTLARFHKGLEEDKNFKKGYR